jgi:hypothetical protein
VAILRSVKLCLIMICLIEFGPWYDYQSPSFVMEKERNNDDTFVALFGVDSRCYDFGVGLDGVGIQIIPKMVRPFHDSARDFSGTHLAASGRPGDGLRTLMGPV